MSISEKLMVERLKKLRDDPRWKMLSLPVPERPEQPEDVFAIEENNGRWRLANSPGMIPGLAAGDVISLNSNLPAGFLLHEHGNNFCVHFFIHPRDFNRAKQEAVAAVEEIGGWLDALMGRTGFSFTLPVDIGFPPLETCFNTLQDNFSDSRWLYSNVYDPETNEPLNWW